MNNHYATLGIDRNATTEEIKAAHRKRSVESHPDRGGSTEEQAAVNEAAEVLLDDERRARYDASLLLDEERRARPRSEIEAEILSVLNNAFEQTAKDPVTFVVELIDRQREDMRSQLARLNATESTIRNNLEAFKASRERDRNPHSYDTVIEAVEADLTSCERDRESAEDYLKRCDEKLEWFNGLLEPAKVRNASTWPTSFEVTFESKMKSEKHD